MDPELDTHGTGTFAWIRIRNNSFRTHNTAFGGILHLELLRILELKLFIFQTVCDGFQFFKITKTPLKNFLSLKRSRWVNKKLNVISREICVHFGILKLKLGRNGSENQKTLKKIRFKKSRCRFLICENLLTLKGYLGTDVKSQ